MQRPAGFLAGLSVPEFMRQHWQKKPLLCRGALPDYQSPLSAEELGGLALEEEVESRIVERADWQLSRGPFTEADFERLGERDWTLLVQDLDQHIPEVGELLSLLDFLPSWRIDDVMASFAVPGGSVGPHFDQYDVFLLQVEGTRHWQWSRQFDPSRLEESELCILSEFEAEEQWELHPGDMLYLPPRVAHYGVATSDCVTFSLGCRAPSVAEIIGHFAAQSLDALSSAGRTEDLRYQDPDGPLQAPAGQLSANEISGVGRLLRQHLSWGPDELARGFARLVTQPKALFTRTDIEQLSAAELSAAWRCEHLRQRKGSRWLYAQLSSGFGLYVDGQEWLLDADASWPQLLGPLCGREPLSNRELRQIAGPQRALVDELLRDGYLEAITEDRR